jgi:hypothetical protein
MVSHGKMGIIFSDRAMYTHICYISLYIRHFMESIIVRVVITKNIIGGILGSHFNGVNRNLSVGLTIIYMFISITTKYILA